MRGLFLCLNIIDITLKGFFAMIRIPALLFVALLSLLACQDNPTKKKDISFYNLLGDVKSVHHVFDYSKLDDQSNIFANQSRRAVFNEQGMLTEMVSHYVDQTHPEADPTVIESQYLYDDNHRLITQYEKLDSEHPSVISFLYKDSEVLPYASTMYGGSQKQMTSLKFDERGNLISAITISNDTEAKSEYYATYNSDDQLVETKRSYGDTYHSSTTKVYNSENRVKSEIHNVNDDKSVLTYEYLKTDSQGNWVERKYSESGKSGYVIEKRTINYF